MNIAARQPDLFPVSNISTISKSRKFRTAPTDKNQQFTPRWVADFAVGVFGQSIDLDPTSSPIANESIRAQRIYTAQDNALTQSWQSDTLFFNPPYGAGLIGPMIDKFLEELPGIGQAIVLVNSSTCARWYQSLLQAADRVLLPRRRINFWTAEGCPIDDTREQYQTTPPGGNQYDQSLFYFGRNTGEFERLGASIGTVYAQPNQTHIETADPICGWGEETHIDLQIYMCVSELNQLQSQGVARGTLTTAARSSGTTRQSYFYPAGGGKPVYVPVSAVAAMAADIARGDRVAKLEKAIALLEQAGQLLSE
jgi:DNA N-6-adenine-methyltransferase (Dam)